MRRLNIGCGNRRIPLCSHHQEPDGWIGIDKVSTPAVDIVRDLIRGLPFEDSSVDEIVCDNVLEHIGPVEDFIFALNEMYRVLKPGCIATIIVPHASSQGAWQDPTHVRCFVPRSALYWNQDLQWAKLYGITADFDVEIWVEGDPDTEQFIRFVCTAREKGGVVHEDTNERTDRNNTSAQAPGGMASGPCVLVCGDSDIENLRTTFPPDPSPSLGLLGSRTCPEYTR